MGPALYKSASINYVEFKTTGSDLHILSTYVLPMVISQPNAELKCSN